MLTFLGPVLFPAVSTPYPHSPGLAVIRRQDDAYETYPTRSALSALSEIPRLRQKDFYYHFRRCDRLAPPLCYSEEIPEHRNSSCLVSVSCGSIQADPCGCQVRLLTSVPIAQKFETGPEPCLQPGTSPQ